MTRLGWFGCLVLVAFFLSGLAAFLIGGLWAVGYVLQAFMWTTFFWLARVVYLEVRADLLKQIRKTKLNYHRTQAFNEWASRSNHRIKGME